MMERTKQTPFLFELSGEHPTLPLAELLATVRAECPIFNNILSGPGYAVIEFDESRLSSIARRLALTHRIGRFIGVWNESMDLAFSIPEGSIALRVRRFQENGKDLDIESITRSLGKHISHDRKVDLTDPDIEMRGFVSDHLLIHMKVCEVDRTQYEQRKVKERPFFSPISLHPKYARALVNLTELKAGQTLLDPFCGTGGILIEASLLGLRTLGSDLSADMIEGCGRNLEHFDLDKGHLAAIDIGSIEETFGKIDGIATDPPYGRSASTNKEELGRLYSRSMMSMRDTLSDDGRLAIIFPRHVDPPEGLMVEQSYLQKVHRSLNRHYSVMKRC
jgi:tRNA (guanine10-N2)-dimethyltransferase